MLCRAAQDIQVCSDATTSASGSRRETDASVAEQADTAGPLQSLQTARQQLQAAGEASPCCSCHLQSAVQ